VLSNTVADGERTVVLSREFAGASAAQHTFNATGDGSTLEFMDAVGSPGLFRRGPSVIMPPAFSFIWRIPIDATHSSD
jgi:hypothetical protein